MGDLTPSGRAARIRSLSLLACASVLPLACSHAESQSARPEPARGETVRAEPEPPPAPRESGAEVAEAPVPDASSLAAGRALVVPGRDGFLTTWQVLGNVGAPLAPEAEARLGTPCESCEEPRVVAVDHFRLELTDIAQRGARSLYLGVTLLAARETRVHLMVGVRGGASVWLDGEQKTAGSSEDRFRGDLLFTPLPVTPGEHRLVVRFDQPPLGRWRGALRFTSDQHRPGLGDVAATVGVLTEERAAELAAAAVRVDEHRRLDERGPILDVRAHLPGGGVARPIEVAIGESSATLAPAEGLHASVHRALLPLPERASRAELSARAGARTWPIAERVLSDRRSLEAAVVLRDALARAPEGARAPIAWRMDELLRLVREHDGDPSWRTVLEGEARRITRALDAGRDPFADVRGYERMAFFSRLDGTAQEYELFVPPGHRAHANRAWPLVVTLHGFKGNAGDYFRNTFGLSRNFEGGESLLAHGRHGAPPTRGPMFVIGPTGRGQAHYRHVGEVDVLEAIEDVRRRFPRIDPSRIYVTGGSMGGTGAAYLPYRHPDLFAASAALAGYHDQRVREDTVHARLSDAERFLVAHRSDIDWAENGLHLPMLLVRGLRDRPLEWTRCLVRRLNDLGYRCEHREPDSGHNVWTETYAEGAIFQWFARYRRPAQPAHVRLRTARERTREAFWVRVEQRSAPDAFAHVDARFNQGVVTASIEGAHAVTFSPGPPLAVEGAPLTVRVGDQSLEGPSPLTIERGSEGWQLATRAYPIEGARRPGVDGPIREVFHEPLTFVVGTHDPDHTFMNRLVARHWARPKGWIVDYPIVADVDVTDEMIRDTTLVLIGPPSSNSILARIAGRLPIRFTDDAIVLGGRPHRGEQVGAAFVVPNPLEPERLVLVIAGPRPLGTWRSTSLPDILPDYVVYDERVAPARDRWACGGTGCEYREHGFFEMDWRLPAQ